MPDLQKLIDRLTLDQKIALLSGRDFWHTVALPEIGLESMRLSDGPSGVRGESFDERRPSISLPSASALSATWSTELAERYGQVAASEAIDKGVQVVLGPTINLHRSPLGGRHFEAYSEDPLLTGEIASAFVRGVQAHNVAACPKHYIANDSETERFTVDAIVDEQTLHELYLKPFQIVVEAAQPWVLMSSYNSVNGHSMSQSPLLETPLKTDWGFDGVVVSDWTAVRTVESAASAQDLAMPGPITPWNAGLKAAVESGEISESAIDEKVRRILLLAQRVGRLGSAVETKAMGQQQRLEIALEVAEGGMVLLKNDHLLPLKPSDTLAVSGDSANRPRIQGGGSATVITENVLSPLTALRKQFGPDQVSYALGAELLSDCATFDLDRSTNTVTGKPGARVSFFDPSDRVIKTEDRESTFFIWEAEPDFSPARLEVEFILDVSGVTTTDIALGAATINPLKIWVDDGVVFSRTETMAYDDIATAILAPPAAGSKVELRGRSQLKVKIEVANPGIPEAQNMISLMIGEIARSDDPEQLIAEAAAQAALAEVAVVVVGTNSAVESEGFDRKNIELPGHQNALVRAVARANKNTVVIVNAGSPVNMPWRHEVSAILVSWFGGQRMSEAIARVLSGHSEPAGRLPTSWVQTDEGSPLSTEPVAGKLHYTEGLNIGYRALSKPIDYPLGFGLGFGDWALLGATVTAAHRGFRVTADLENSSTRASSGLCLVFASKPDSTVSRPNKWLVGWGRTKAISGKDSVEISIDAKKFQHYSGSWQLEHGSYELEVVLDAAQPGVKLTIEL